MKQSISCVLFSFFLLAAYPTCDAFAQTKQANNLEAILNAIASYADRTCPKIETSGGAEKWVVAGEGKADLQKLLKKLVDLGVNIKGSLEVDSYKNLLRSDLPKALNDAANCKLKVLEYFKDWIKPSVATVGYSKVKQDDDLRLVGEFLRQFGTYKHSASNDLGTIGCEGGTVAVKTTQLSIASGQFKLTQVTDFSNYKCKSESNYVHATTDTTYEATLADLDGSLRVMRDDNSFGDGAVLPGFAKIILVNCLAGSCAAVKIEKTEERNSPSTAGMQLTPVKKEDSAITEFIRLKISAPTGTPQFRTFARALSRLISDGSDEKLCRKYSELCVS